MKFIPHDYQAFAIEFLKEHSIAALLLDMGLGKTIITLKAIFDLMYDRFEVSRVLVIAPLRVAKNTWPDEIKKWDGMELMSYAVAIGTPAQRKAALKSGADITIINRENVSWLVEKSGVPFDFDMVVIDELSSFKNGSAKRFKSLMKVRPKIKRIVGLTGTPAPAGLMDLWAEIKILDMGERLGRFISRYRETYFKPAAMNPYTGVVYNYVPLPGAEQQIYDRIGDITISMKALDYLDMPECVSVTHEVEMDEKERAVYEKLKKDLVLTIGGEDITASNAAVLSGKLLQMANGAMYSDDGGIVKIHDRKLLMLEDLVEQANGQSVLIAYWYKHDRQRIIEHLRGLGYQPRDLKSSEDIADWNAGKIPVAIISPASAGHGLNIQEGGHILIWFSGVWSLEMVQQTNARLWRQGQREVVTIHHIICKGTVDEDVLKAIEYKDTTQENLIQAVRAHLNE